MRTVAVSLLHVEGVEELGRREFAPVPERHLTGDAIVPRINLKPALLLAGGKTLVL